MSKFVGSGKNTCPVMSKVSRSISSGISNAINSSSNKNNNQTDCCLSDEEKKYQIFCKEFLGDVCSSSNDSSTNNSYTIRTN